MANKIVQIWFPRLLSYHRRTVSVCDSREKTHFRQKQAEMGHQGFRSVLLVVTLALTLVLPGAAQYKRPAPRTQPRGTAVVELLPGGKKRLIPVCIFFENKFYDAQFYQIRTVPMALQGDTLYEVQRAGEPIGLFTVDTAYRNGTRWSAEGKWKSYSLADKRADELREQQRAIAQAKEDKAAPGEFRLPGGGGSDRGRGGKRNPKDKGGDTSKSGDDSKSDKSGSKDSDPDRPTLHRRDDSTAADNTPPADDDPDRPTLKRKEQEKPAAESTVAKAESQPQPTRDEDRPKLRHTTAGEKEQSGADLPNATAGPKGASGAASPEATYVAVSDPQPVESRSMVLGWSAEEQQEVARKMESMAQAELRKALPLRIARIAPKVLPLTNAETRAFDLDMSNNPIVVLAASYAAPLNGPGAAPDTAQGAPYRVLLVARQNAEGQLIKLMSHVSDPKDLDGSPELRLVDAVDVDGDGRGELLFRKSTASGTGWLVERVTPYETEVIFDGAAH